MLDSGSVSSATLLRRLIKVAGDHDTVVLNGADHTEQVAAALIPLRRRGTRVVLAECTWEVGDSFLDRLATRAGARAIDRGDVTYCVLSMEERDTFSRSWGIDRSRVVFTPYCYSLSEQELSVPVTDGGFVFAGGDSHRDYPTLVEAARGLGAPVRIAARRNLIHNGVGLPENVAAGRTSHRQFVELMASARAVVVPLQARDDRSAGQATYLGAMAFGKPVIVTDVIGVRDYVEPNETAVVVPPGDPGAMRAALDWVLADENRDAVRQLGARARRAVLGRFGPEAYVEALLAAVDAERRA